MSRLLMASGASKDAVNKDGLTALALATQYGHTYQLGILK
jgi:hypothetical protein